MSWFISAAHAASGGDGHGGEAATGLPQLDFSSWPGQIIWLLITLVVLYMMFTRIALPKIGGVIEERSDAIEDDLERTAEFKRKAEEAEAAYEKALADARAEAQKIAAAARAEMQKEVDAMTAKADAEIAARTAESEKRLAQIRDEAREAVRVVAGEAAVELVAAVAPGSADDDTVTAAVARRMEG